MTQYLPIDRKPTERLRNAKDKDTGLPSIAVIRIEECCCHLWFEGAPQVQIFLRVTGLCDISRRNCHTFGSVYYTSNVQCMREMAKKDAADATALYRDVDGIFRVGH